MIGVGIAANVAEFVITTILGRRITLALDQKKQAARAFMDLFESIRCLEQALRKLEPQLETVVSGRSSRLYAVPIGQVIEELEDGTNLFNRAFNRMESLIDIFDPQLSEMLFGILAQKQQIFWTNNFPIELKIIWGNPDCVFTIEVHEMAATTNLGLEKLYNQFSRIMKDPFSRSSMHIDPITRREIASNDKEQLELLLLELREHVSSLSLSRKRMAEFIRSQFSLEDLLR